MNRSQFFYLPALLLAVLLLGLLSACAQEDAAPARSAAVAAQLVEVALVRDEQVTLQSERSGTLRAEREIRVLPQEEGRIVQLPWQAGDQVTEGALLFQLDDALLLAELRKNSAQRRQLEIELGRVEKLFAQRLISEEQLLQARTALDVTLAEEQLLRTRLDYTRFSAPFTGLISARLAEPGDVVARFTHLLTLTDPASLVTAVPVSELLLPHLDVGDAVEVRIDALGQQRFAGTIRRIHPAVDAATRQGMVEIALDPVPAGARAGQLCRVQFSARPQLRRLIPYAALRRDTNGEFVFLVDDDSRARRQAVISGLQLGEDIELLDGPDSGSRIVVRGFLGLNEGRTVRIAPDGGETRE